MAEAKKTAGKTAAKKEDTKAEKKPAKKTVKKDEEKAEKKPAKKTAKKEEEAEKKPAKKTSKKAETEAKEAEAFLEYKGKPLVRSGNMIYYGDINDAYVVCLMIKSETEVNGEKIADDVQVQLLATDETLPPKDRVIKKSEKKGLFTALDLGVAWLERQLKKG